MNIGRIIKPKIPLVSDAEDPGTSLTPFNVAELSSTNSDILRTKKCKIKPYECSLKVWLLPVLDLNLMNIAIAVILDYFLLISSVKCNNMLFKPLHGERANSSRLHPHVREELYD